MGVRAVAVPTFEPAGQPAGLTANWASAHAFWIVVKRDGSASGSCTSTLWMFASPGFCATLTSSEAPFGLLVSPRVETANDGLNARLPQSPTWKRELTEALIPPTEVIVAPICVG